MILTILESPYAAATWIGRWQNVRYARRCVRDSLMRNEAPIASHLLYTQPGILLDGVPGQRARGIEAGLAWGKVATLTAVYTDRGISSSMRQGILNARKAGRTVVVRSLRRMNVELPDELR